MRLYLHPQNPEPRLVKKIVEMLLAEQLIIVPTDTVYAFVTLAQNKESVRQIQRIKNLPPNKPLTLYCRDFSQMSRYVRMQGNQVFHLMKALLPGPYTLIFDAAKTLPHYAVTRQNTVGIRIVDHRLIMAILDQTELPLLGSSVDLPPEEMHDFEELADRYENRVAAVVHCGAVAGAYSTILDVRRWPPVLVRAGLGALPDVVVTPVNS
ncbi:MAG: L-threonylcarbamoyladenylate synthase [Leptospiraceae bacterium]|nr:L-threonylcarbamoyladenylate synthase [Leptospiraceae bacterium]